MRRSSILSVVVACLFLMGGLAHGQVAPIDFEADGNGADWTWTVFENGTNPAVAIIANPNAAGINTSATVAEFTALDAGMDWAGTENLDIGEFTFDATNSTVKVMVHKSVMSDFRIKFEGASAPVEINAANTLTDEWEELTYDFSSVIGNTYNKLVLFPDFAPRDQDNVIYFDNITFSAQMVVSGPEVAAPAPTQADEDVISVFSDAYTDLAGTDFNPNWGQSTLVTTIDVAGSATLEYANFNYQGTQLASPVDVSGMTHLHVDMWTSDASTVNIFPISVSTGERSYPLPVVADTWTSYDIPLTFFTDQELSLADIHQFKFDGGDGAVTIYLDNLYFYADAVTPSPFPTHTVDFESDGVGADWNWTMAENGDNPPLEFVANPVSGGINTSATVAQFIARADGNPWALVHTGDDGEFTFDATNSMVKIMVYKPVLTNVGFKVEGSTGTPTEIQVANTVINEWEELTFDFSAVEGQSFNRMVIIPDFLARAQENMLYFDNIQVPDGFVPPPPAEPTVAAPTPTLPEAEVMSIYSGAYTDLAETNFNPNWGQTTVVTVDADVAGDATLKYESLNYQGTNLGGPDGVDQDVSAYQFLHIDFWTPNASTLNFFLISRSSGEQAFSLPIVADEWVGVDIPLSHFTDLGMVLTDIFQFKVDGGDGSTNVWFDNWFFHGDAPVEPDPGLFFSEYAEGSSNNKYVEIYNPTGMEVDLSTYSVQGTNNGTAWGDNGERDLPLTGILAPGAVYVIAADQASPAILEIADLALPYESPLHYNGDDGIALLNNGLIIDAIGVDGVVVPGWDVAGVPNATADHTLVRKDEVMYGNIGNWEMSAGTDAMSSQWIVADGPTADYTPATLGWHMMPPPPPAPLVAAPAAIHDAADVMSIYSAAYDNLAETNFNPNWGQSTIVTLNADVAGDTTHLLYEGLNYQGTNLGGPDGVDQNVAGYQFIHIDFWTANAPALNFFLISRSSGEQAFSLPIVPGEWVSVDIPLSYFTDLGMVLTDIFQFKVDGGDGATNVWFDNWYFHTPVPPPPPPIVLEGAWVMAPMAGALAVGPNPFDGSWWANSEEDVLTRACFFDDKYVFNADGSFQNVLDGDTWLETWQGVEADGCGAPIAPHDGMTPATWSVDHVTRTVTLNGVGSYLGIPKAFNGGELGNPVDAPASITYEVHVNDSSRTIQLVIDIGGGFWTYTMVPAPLPPIHLEGAWVMAPMAGALAVGPNPFDGSWWASSEEDVLTRACFFDDKYVFNADGSFHNALDGETWLETWQGVEADGCGAPIAPHDGMTPASWSIDPEARTVTIEGVGSYLGIPKAFNGGELADPADAPPSITYEVHPADSGLGISLVLDIGGGFWTFHMVPAPPMPPPVPLVAAPTPDIDASEVFSIFSDAYTDLAETNFDPDWGQSTEVLIVDIEGNATLAYGHLNYQGTNLGGPDGVDQDVSGYDFIHVDLWTANATELNFFLISRSSGEQAYSLPITPMEWVSVDIPLSHFTDLGMVLTDIYQFKVDGGNGETMVWFDNWFFHTLNTTSVDENLVPEEFALSQNYPNPFNPSTTIDYSVAEAGHVTLKIYNITGQEVVTVVDEMVAPGYYSTYFDASNLATGTYFYALTAGKERSVKKMVLIK